jgi:hypothetical protein
LKRFREIDGGAPAQMSNSEWLEILDKMIMAFELIVRNDGSRIYTAFEHERIDVGLNLFREYYMALWW